MKMSRPKISVLLPTYNEQEIIRDCLESIKWADEILVVDSFSTDRTLDIVQEYGARIIQHEYINSARQKNWAFPQCQHEWILQIDTDEILEEGAEDEIINTISTTPSDVQAYKLPRKNHFLGKWIKNAGMYPDFQTRLFRKDSGKWQDREVHAHVQVPNKVGILEHHIIHYGAPALTRQLRNIDRYTRYEADELKKRGKRFHWSKLLIHPWMIFFYRYFFLKGFLDGWRGFIICVYLSFYSFFTHAKLWELDTLGLDHSPK
jgi:glycosyltransferase involved in cell wall biosynthesis